MIKYPPVDTAKIKTYPLAQRQSKVDLSLLGSPLAVGASFKEFLAGLPRLLAVQDLQEVVLHMAAAYRQNKPVILGMGAHPIKVGLSPFIVDFVEKGIISAIATNGAGIIHDFEMACSGATSEEVGEALDDGSFGMARETGEFLNQAIAEGVRKEGLGIGAAVGKKILAEKLPYRQLSLLATAARQDIPITVHVALGTDTIHMHPEVDGQAIGEGSLRDFRLFTSVVAGLEGGVFINLGSAVIIPEVFLKALSLARNLGHHVQHFTTVNMDFIRHYRPSVNIVNRPTRQGGQGFHLTGHHEIMFPLLCAAVLEELAARS